jgi:hypothetical protein
MAEIVTHAVEEQVYEVEVADRGARHHFRVSVPDDLVERTGADPAAIVRATFAFLLEREPVDSILGTFDCSVVARYFPEYQAELPRYLQGPGDAGADRT